MAKKGQKGEWTLENGISKLGNGRPASHLTQTQLSTHKVKDLQILKLWTNKNNEIERRSERKVDEDKMGMKLLNTIIKINTVFRKQF